MGVGILLRSFLFMSVLIVTVVLAWKFCCNFSDNKENKEHKKTLKKNTEPKLKKKRVKN